MQLTALLFLTACSSRPTAAPPTGGSVDAAPLLQGLDDTMSAVDEKIDEVDLLITAVINSPHPVVHDEDTAIPVPHIDEDRQPGTDTQDTARKL